MSGDFALDSADAWAAYLTVQARMRCGCHWRCHLCGGVHFHADPVAAIRLHLAAAHGDGRPRWADLFGIDPHYGEQPPPGIPSTPGRSVEPPPTTEALRAAPVGSAGTTPTTVSTDVRAARSIYDGTRWGR
jgi:hypothetical protein